MINLKINKTDLKICESTAQVAVLNPTMEIVDEIAELITNSNYTCQVIYPESDSALSLASKVGGKIEKDYDRFVSYISQFT